MMSLVIRTVCVTATVSSSLPPGLNSNLNVPLDMGVGGLGVGAVSYKEPPQSKLKKLWATDPLEQNSKPGTRTSGWLVG